MHNLFIPNLHKATATNQSGLKVNQTRFDKFGNLYQYVQHESGASNSALPGNGIGWRTGSAGATVTSDFSRTTTAQGLGIAMSSLSPALPFGWVLIRSANIQGIQMQTVGTTEPLGFTQLKIRTNTTVAAGNLLRMTANAAGAIVFDGLTALTAGSFLGQSFGADGGSSGDLLSTARIGWVA